VKIIRSWRETNKQSSRGLETRALKLFAEIAQQYIGRVVPEARFFEQLTTWLKPQFAKELVEGLVRNGDLIRPVPRTLAQIFGPTRTVKGVVSRVETVWVPARVDTNSSYSPDARESRAAPVKGLLIYLEGREKPIVVFPPSETDREGTSSTKSTEESAR